MKKSMVLEGEQVTPREILSSREARRDIQQRLLAPGNCVLICMTLNIPGDIKVFKESIIVFELGVNALVEELEESGEKLEMIHVEKKNTGYELYIALNSNDGENIKSICVRIEEEHPFGRLFDIDVLTSDCKSVSRTELGLQPRKCMVCDNVGHACVRSQKHPVDEILETIIKMIRLNLKKNNI